MKNKILLIGLITLISLGFCQASSRQKRVIDPVYDEGAITYTKELRTATSGFSRTVRSQIYKKECFYWAAKWRVYRYEPNLNQPKALEQMKFLICRDYNTVRAISNFYNTNHKIPQSIKFYPL